MSIFIDSCCVFAKLWPSFMEGTRLRAVVALFRDVATSTTIQDGSRSIKVKPGQRIVIDLV